MAKLKAVVSFVIKNFGPLVVFYAVNHFWGLKPAIAFSVAFTIVEVGLMLYRKEKISGILIFSAVMTLVFGVVDLYAQQSFLFKYEAMVSNLLTAAFFGVTLFSERSILQDFYEKSKNPRPLTRDLVAYFRMLTAVWVIYFLAKAAAYFWVAQNYSLEQGLIIRILVGSGSFYAMLALSVLASRKIFPLLKKWGVLPEAETLPVAESLPVAEKPVCESVS